MQGIDERRGAMPSRRRVGAGLLVVLANLGSAAAATAGLLEGTVIDATGQPLPQVTVTARPATGDDVHVHSSDLGSPSLTATLCRTDLANPVS